MEYTVYSFKYFEEIFPFYSFDVLLIFISKLRCAHIIEISCTFFQNLFYENYECFELKFIFENCEFLRKENNFGYIN